MLINSFLLLGISAAWAAGYLFIGAARQVPPITATAMMTAIAAVVIMLIVRLVQKRPLWPVLSKRPWVPIIMGLSAIALPNLSVVMAEHTIPADLAAVLGSTVPITTVLITTFVTRETAYSHLRMLGILIAVAGLVIFVGWRDLVADPAELGGVAIMMTGGMIFALNGLFAARQTKDLDASALAVWTILFGAIYLWASAFLIEQPLTTEIGPAIWPLVGEGILGMGVAYLGYYMLVARAGAGFTSLYAFLVPVLGVLAASLVFGEPLTADHAAGLVTVLAGLLLVTQAERIRAIAGHASGSRAS